jgi:uncharacterized SAM-binding protein YcdF (DUF218 family)
MDTLFFVASKIVWALIRPETWLVLGLAAAFLLVRRRPALARGLIGVLFVLTVTIGYLPVGSYMVQGLESRFPANPPIERVDGIIVLGGAEDTGPSLFSGQPELNAAGERMSSGAALALAWPEARLVFSGGSGGLIESRGTPRNAELARDFFLQFGIAPERIMLEPRSRNTAENAAFSLAVVDPQPGETWVLVTSAWHMPRAMESFARAGWPAIVPWPVDHRGMAPSHRVRWNLAENLDELNLVAKEWVGGLAYDLTGR